MNDIVVVLCNENLRLNETLAYALEGVAHARMKSADALPRLAGKRVLFAIGLSEHGLDVEVIALIAALRQNPKAMEGATGAILLDGAGELYTKQTADMLALAANLAGCFFPGKPLVEATGSLDNWNVQSLRRGVSLAGAYRQAARELVLRLAAFSPKKKRGRRCCCCTRATGRPPTRCKSVWRCLSGSPRIATSTKSRSKTAQFSTAGAVPIKPARILRGKTAASTAG